MSKYHVNTKGEPGVCQAAGGRCPFGAPEEHYSSEMEARIAYEAAMSGETIQVHVKKLLDDHHRREKELAAYRASYRQPETVVPELDESLLPPLVMETRREQTRKSPVEFRPGDEFEDGAKIVSTKLGKDYATVEVAGESTPRIISFAEPKHRIFTSVQRPTHESQVARNEAKSAQEEAIRIAEAERTYEEVTLNGLPRRRTKLRDEIGHMGAHFNFLAGGSYEASHTAAVSKWTRVYVDKVSDFKRNGVANPHTHALEYLKKVSNTPYGANSGWDFSAVDEQGARLVQAIITRDKFFQPNSGQRKALAELYSDANRPEFSQRSTMPRW